MTEPAREAVERIFILDEIQVKPGLAAAYREAYRTTYAPRAKQRGMRLEGAWQHPPGKDYEELPTTLYFLWSVEGYDGYWAMRKSHTASGADERFEKLSWWQDSDRMTLTRKRRMLGQLPQEA